MAVPTDFVNPWIEAEKVDPQIKKYNSLISSDGRKIKRDQLFDIFEWHSTDDGDAMTKLHEFCDYDLFGSYRLTLEGVHKYVIAYIDGIYNNLKDTEPEAPDLSKFTNNPSDDNVIYGYSLRTLLNVSFPLIKARNGTNKDAPRWGLVAYRTSSYDAELFKLR